MKPLTRFILNASLPPLIASAILAFLESPEFTNAFWELPLLTIALAGYAYIFAALPSMLHASMMEAVYPKLKPSHPFAILLSGASGTVAGIFIHVIKMPAVYGSSGTHSFILLGTTTGLLLGLILATLDRRVTRKAILG